MTFASHDDQLIDDIDQPNGSSTRRDGLLRRRTVLGLAGGGLAATVLARLGARRTGPLGSGADTPDEGRLSARPAPPVDAPLPAGLHHLGLRAERDALLYVPTTVPDGAAPLVVALHGAGGDAQAGLAPLIPLADEAGLVLLAPVSQGRTWDVIDGGYGPDVAFIDRALRATFAHHAVDPDQIFVAGFSDGASYALSLGLANGSLFRRVVAFSPGFAADGRRVGRPSLFVSHGVHDRVLPIGPTSRSLVPELRRAGYDVDYREFDGGHTVPPDIAAAAVSWLTGPQP